MSTFSYDADGRTLTQSAFRRDETVQVEWRRTLNGFEEHYTGVKAWVEAAYNEMQRNPDASWQVVQRYQLQTLTLSESTVTNFTSTAPTAARYNWRGQLVSAATPGLGYDAAGVLRGYTVQEISGGTVRWTDTYSYEYSLQDGYLETKVTGTSSERNRRASETLSGYDGWGRRTSLEERTNLKREFGTVLRSARYFAYDAEGGLISRREGELVEVQGQTLLQFRQARKEDDKFKNFNPVPHLIEQPEWDALSAGEREYWAGAANTHRYSFANGQLLGSVNEAGRMSVGDRLTGFENSSLGTSTVVVRSGETLRSVAQRIYGDGSLWYVLADANGLTNSDETLAEGQNLQVPQVGTNTNSASTFKPYDPSEQIGPTAPSLPTIAPPPKNSCNPIAQLLMVIVAVAVSFATWGAASGPLIGALGKIGGAMAAGAVSGAAGSMASGVAGSVTGVSSFSWRNVASNAVSGAITAGVGAAIGPVGGQLASVGRLLDAGRPIAAAGLALTNAAASYIGNKVVGVEGTSFSWRNIAGSAVGSMISSAAFNGLGWDDPGTFEVSGSFGHNLVTGFVGGLVSAHTQKAFGADVNINEGRMALDAFGNAVGNALGGQIDLARQRREFDRQMGVFNERTRQSTDERMKGLTGASAQHVNDLLDARITATANDQMAKTAEKMAARGVPMPSMAPVERWAAGVAAERARREAAIATARSDGFRFFETPASATRAGWGASGSRASGGEIKWEMRATPEPGLLDRMVDVSTRFGPGLAAKYIAGFVDDVGVTLGFGERIKDHNGMEYRESPILGRLMNPGDVLEARQGVILEGLGWLPGAQVLRAGKVANVPDFGAAVDDVANGVGPTTNTIFVTRSGVAIPSDDLGRLGSSHLAGNFRGLEGASIDEIFARTPRGWTWAPQDRGAGIKLIDTQGYERIRIHGPSARAPVGSNSASGWTMRIMDRAGNYYDNFGSVVPYRANSGHIPIQGNPVLGRNTP